MHLALLTARDLVGAAVPDSVIAALEPKAFDPSLVTLARALVLEQMAEEAASRASETILNYLGHLIRREKGRSIAEAAAGVPWLGRGS